MNWKEYVIDAAHALTALPRSILWFAVLPNIAAGLVTEIAALSMAILDIAASFLDLGAQLLPLGMGHARRRWN